MRFRHWLTGTLLLLLYLQAAFAAEDRRDEASDPPIPATSGGMEKEGIDRWLELDTAQLNVRYQYVADDAGETLASHGQHRQIFRARFKFDPEGRYSIRTRLGSGRGFRGGWNGLGIENEARGTLNFKEFFLAARPWDELELQYGGIDSERGVATEITTLDSHSYLTGGRLIVREPDYLFFDEIVATVAYLGIFDDPNAFARLDRLDQSNYHQLLVAKDFSRVRLTAEYNSQLGIAILRQAAAVQVPELRIVDSVRFENYQRLEGETGYGFGLEGFRWLHRRLSVSAGYASIDRDFLPANGDRYGQGNRVFLTSRLLLLPGLGINLFFQTAVANDEPVPNGTRLDLVLSYDLLSILPWW